MEIKFDNRNTNMYREVYCQTRQIQESTESVVPDTNEDIAMVAVVQSSVLLKSKDVTARGVLISGEAQASLIYITESQDKVSFVKLSKPFSMEYDVGDCGSDAVAQIRLSVLSAEARVINPRKVSVSFNISGELSCYIPETLCVETALDRNKAPGLHAKYDLTEINIVSAVCEKTFTINEQFSFPSGKPRPSRFVSASAEFIVNDTQLIGTKAIVKGDVELSVSYLSDEVNYPVRTEFTTGFSQIIDIGEQETDSCSIMAELTGAYFDLADSINGDKLLDVELHAVMQLVCRSNKSIVYVSDAYSNQQPALCKREKLKLKMLSESRKIKMSADERINVNDDCADILSIFAELARLNQEQGRLKAMLNLDIVYRAQSGRISAVRRNISMETESGMKDCRIVSERMCDVYFRPDGQFLDGHLSVELGCISCGEIEIDTVCAVDLDEESQIAFEEFPTLSLVRCSGESLWELAKTYHSSVEKISACNEVEGDLDGKMLLIPKSL